jgi:dTDP-4-amino-4,6-dideoxygalactose transaminase
VGAGGVPRFVDVDPDTGLLDLDAAEAAVDGTVWGVVPVHLYGRLLDMSALCRLADRYGLTVVEDAAQANGARRDGRAAGTFGAIGCFSFYPGKNLGAFGDAGVAITDDDELADTLRQLREHGRRDHQSHVRVGFNSRMDPLQAAVLRIKLRHLDHWNARRRTAAALYRERLPGEVLDGFTDGGEADVHHLFPILVPDRDRVIAELAAAGIQTGIHYAEPLHLTAAFTHVGGCAPVAERRAQTQLSLPMHPHLRREDVERIADAVTDAVRARAA